MFLGCIVCCIDLAKADNSKNKTAICKLGSKKKPNENVSIVLVQKTHVALSHYPEKKMLHCAHTIASPLHRMKEKRMQVENLLGEH